MSRQQDPSQPRDPQVQIDVTLTLPRQLIWLLAGIALGHPHALSGVVEKVGHLLRTLTG